jgi:hypothetical protein
MAPVVIRLITTIRARLVCLQRALLGVGLIGKRFLEWFRVGGMGIRVDVDALTLALSFAIPEFPIHLELVITKTFLEEGGDVVGDPLELLVAFSLCSLETACDMATDKGHGNGIL